MFPTQEQIKGLLELPFEQATAGACLMADKLKEQSKAITDKMKMLELVMTQLLKKNEN